MADNVAITAGAGTSIATDDVSGVQYQRVKIALGADGAAADVAPGQTTMAASLPVVIASNQSAIAVSGTVTASGPLTDAQLRASVVPVSLSSTSVSGTVTANAGTNLNTSTLALEAGGNLATLVARTPVLGQAAAASSSPVALANEQILDQYITGQGSQLSINQNVIRASAGSGSTDAQQYRAWSIMIVPAAGTVTAGNITFEGSNDNTNFVSLPMYDTSSPNNLPVTTYALAATTNRFFSGPAPFRYVRARISTGVTGTTTGIQAFTILSMAPFIPPGAMQVVNQTAANLNVTIGSGTVTTVSTVTTCSTLTNITNWGNIVDNAAFTDGTTRLSPNAYIFDEVAGTALTENDAAAARIDSKRAQVFVVEDATTRGQRQTVGTDGAALTRRPDPTQSFVNSAASTNATSVKASAGSVFGIVASNTHATNIAYLKFYNKASAPTVGTDVPVFVIPIPALGGVERNLGAYGHRFGTGIALAITGGAADTDTAAVGANDVKVATSYA